MTDDRLPPPRRSIYRHRCNLRTPTRRGAVTQCTKCHRRYTARPSTDPWHGGLVWRRRWWPWPRPTRSRVELPRSTSRDFEAIERHWYGPDS